MSFLLFRNAYIESSKISYILLQASNLDTYLHNRNKVNLCMALFVPFKTGRGVQSLLLQHVSPDFDALLR